MTRDGDMGGERPPSLVKRVRPTCQLGLTGTEIRALFADKPDPQAHPNAVHHATGKRIRELSTTPEKLL